MWIRLTERKRIMEFYLLQIPLNFFEIFIGNLQIFSPIYNGYLHPRGSDVREKEFGKKTERKLTKVILYK